MNGYRRLPLQGMHNARDLGGFPAEKGITKYAVFVRSENPRELTLTDLKFLKKFNLTTDIDMRSEAEILRTPDVLGQEKWIRYVHIPLDDEFATRGSLSSEAKENIASFGWSGHYLSMCENNKNWIRNVITTMAESDGAILFHCAAGKDRTGVIAAILLSLAGVSALDIAADYSVSEIYLRRRMERMQEIRRSRGEHNFTWQGDPLFSTHYGNIEPLISHFNENYSGTSDFLRGCGVLKKNIDAVKSRLLAKT